MFTGIIQESAIVESFEKSSEGDFFILIVRTQLDASAWKIGDSIANNGVCLTLVEKSVLPGGSTLLRFDLGPETMAVSSFENLKFGDKLHLEPALKLGDPLGGHMVSGHVDATAVVSQIIPQQDILTLVFSLEGKGRNEVAPFLVKKGSIAVNGVSLTVNELKDTKHKTDFSVTLIPHTLELTHFLNLKLGDLVNIEADMMAKQAARYAEYWKGTNA